MMEMLYYILLDIFYYRSLVILIQGYKQFVVQRLGGFYFKDLYHRVHLSRVGKYLLVQDGHDKDGGARPCINFSSYDYLGVSEWEKDSIMLDDEHDEHDDHDLQDIETCVQDFLGYRYVILSGTGYSANAFFLESIIKENLVFSDEYNHYSIIDGIKSLDKHVFRHRDLHDLETRLGHYHDDPRKKYVIIEGTYSMHGHLYDLPSLLQLKKKYPFILIVDEAHSFGCVGAHGKGITEYYHVDIKHIDVYIGTFSKTCNAYGGFIATDDKETYHALQVTKNLEHQEISFLSRRHITRVLSYVMSEKGKDDLYRLHQISTYAHEIMSKNGYRVLSDGSSPVLCIDYGYIFESVRAARYTLTNNLALVFVGYPAAGAFRLTLRLCLSVYHDKEDVDYLLSVLQGKPNRCFQTRIQEKHLPIYRYRDFATTQEVIRAYGIGSAGPYGFYGILSLYSDVQDIIARFFQKEKSILLTHGACGIKSLYEHLQKSCRIHRIEGIEDLQQIDPHGGDCCLHLTRNILPEWKLCMTTSHHPIIHIIMDLNLLCRKDVQGCLLVSHESFIQQSLNSIKSHVFSAAFPAYIYFEIGNYFEHLGKKIK